MMKLNSFEHALNMPEQPPVDENHPFVRPADPNNTDDARTVPERQYVAHLPERKEWQQQLPTQDAAQVFKPVGETENKR